MTTIERPKMAVGGDWQRGRDGAILPGRFYNIRLAMTRLGVKLRYSEDPGLPPLVTFRGEERQLDDRLATQLWTAVRDEFGFSMPRERFRMLLGSIAARTRRANY